MQPAAAARAIVTARHMQSGSPNPMPRSPTCITFSLSGRSIAALRVVNAELMTLWSCLLGYLGGCLVQ